MLLNMDEPDFEEAENQILTGIEPDDKNNVKWHLACVYALYAELFKQKGDPLKTREKHEKAIYVFKACGANGWAKKYEKKLTEI
jgi:DICT domain-containing protein